MNQEQAESKAGEAGAAVFALSIIFAYLFLVAQYESWTIPIPVMLSVVFAVLGALAWGQLVVHLDGLGVDHRYGERGGVIAIQHVRQ